ncbi:MAG: hypothetical protein SCALA702_26000 [Melioribacteraceae bacterium]|nr:MAG: hypothetical protein SCALA702_26000 [Melioribacteraceae bacterium]
MNAALSKSINVIVILLVFALTGTSTAYISGLLTSALGVEKWSLLFWVVWLIFIFPLYQGLTLVFAFIFGKFDYFYTRQKKIANKVLSLFKRKDASRD